MHPGVRATSARYVGSQYVMPIPGMGMPNGPGQRQMGSMFIREGLEPPPMEMPAIVTGNMLFQFTSLMGLKTVPWHAAEPERGEAVAPWPVASPRAIQADMRNRFMAGTPPRFQRRRDRRSESPQPRVECRL